MVNTYQSRNIVSQLLTLSGIDEVDEVDATWMDSFRQLNEFIGGTVDDQQVPATLQAKVAENAENVTVITQGLVYGILTDASRPEAIYLAYLSKVVRDGFSFVVSLLRRIVFDKYTKLVDLARTRLVWLVSELVGSNAKDVDQLCEGLLRQAPGGDTSPKAVWLCEELVQLFTEHKGWLYSSAKMIPYVAYSFLRLVTDHGSEQLAVLRAREVALCVDLLRNKFSECQAAGRDLVRLLQDVARLPEFAALWRDLAEKPKSFSPQFGGVHQLLAVRSPRRFLLARVTPDMEAQLLFVLRQVKMGHQKRYQQWFHQNFLPTPEHESLVPDLIRFICCVYHPPNHILSSDICPRWAVVGWLLNLTSKSVAVTANARLALFYDWLFFDPQKDNIMNIEPGMLLMMHSLHKYPQFSATLLEFLMLTMENYDASRPEMTRRGVQNSLHIMLSKGVVGSIDPLVSCPAIDPKLRPRVLATFGQFMASPPASKAAPPPSPARAREKPSATPSSGPGPGPGPGPGSGSGSGSGSGAGAGSGSGSSSGSPPSSLSGSGPGAGQATSPRSQGRTAEVARVEQQKRRRSLPDEDVEMGEAKDAYGGVLDQHASAVLALLRDAGDKGLSTEVIMSFQAYLRKYCSAMRQASAAEKEALEEKALQFLLEELGERFIVHGECAKAGGGQRAGLLVDEAFALVCKEHSGGEKGGGPAARLVEQLRAREAAVGYHFLLFVAGLLHDDLAVQRMLVAKASAPKPKRQGGGANAAVSEALVGRAQALIAAVQHEERLSNGDGRAQYAAYLALAGHSEARFLDDCRLCLRADAEAFFWMLPYLCGHVSFTASEGFVRMVVAFADPRQFGGILGGLMNGGLELLGSNALAITRSSLTWDSYEQQLLWQLVRAEFTNHEIAGFAASVLSAIDPAVHHEALSALRILLHGVAEKRLVETVVSLSPLVFNNFPSDLLCTWYISELQTVVNSALEKYIKKLTAKQEEKQDVIASVLANLVAWYHRMALLESLGLVDNSLNQAIWELAEQFDERIPPLLPKSLAPTKRSKMLGKRSKMA